LVNDYKCNCTNGYSGKNCDINLDDCKPTNPCVNGVCEDLVGGYKCKCNNGWKGEKCDIKSNPCSGSPCKNGKCVADFAKGTYTCNCNSGYSGPNCE